MDNLNNENQISSTFDIRNNTPRKVVCTSVQEEVWGGNNGEKLELGKEYNVRNVEIHSWHTRVFLEEFPEDEIGFNSILFSEIV